MGNRAVITTSEKLDGIGLYLHWNGGRDSVEAFLEYCRLRGYPSPEMSGYGWARMAQVIGNFFGGTNSIGLDLCNNLDCNNGDNGTYIIRDWKIVARKYMDNDEQQCHDLRGMLKAIDAAQPATEQIGSSKFPKARLRNSGERSQAEPPCSALCRAGLTG